jgi:hypothetical protein
LRASRARIPIRRGDPGGQGPQSDLEGLSAGCTNSQVESNVKDASFPSVLGDLYVIGHSSGRLVLDSLRLFVDDLIGACSRGLLHRGVTSSMLGDWTAVLHPRWMSKEGIGFGRRSRGRRTCPRAVNKERQSKVAPPIGS